MRALKEVGAFVTGVGEAPLESLDPQLRDWLDAYEAVPSLLDEEAVTDVVRRAQRRGPWVDRLEATLESHVLLAARVRERTGIAGLSSQAVLMCRDKFKMKQLLRSRGVPCAANAAVSTPEDAREFAAAVGYPVILKPRDGQGAVGTVRIDDEAALEEAIRAAGLDRRPTPMTMEEYIQGHEGFFDTLICNGNVVFEGICHYYPGVLEAMRTRECSPQILITNRDHAQGYQELKELGRRVVRTLGLSTTATHMEWFFGPRGLLFSEIGARPPHIDHWTLYNHANDMDLHRSWAEAICLGRTSPQPSRRFSAGLVSLRPPRDGVIVGYRGLDELQRKYGPWAIKAHLPPPGTPTRPIEEGYMANAWVWMKHHDYDELRYMLDEVGRTLEIIVE